MISFKRLPNLSLAAALCSLTPMAIGCDEPQICGAVGCGPSEFRLVKDDWAPGEYEIEVAYSAAGDVSFRCIFQVSDVVDGDAADSDDAGATTTEPTCTQLTGSDRSVQLFVNASRPTLQVFDSPATLQLTLRGMGQTLFEDTISPDYTDQFPNGSDCGACQMASMSVDIP